MRSTGLNQVERRRLSSTKRKVVVSPVGVVVALVVAIIIAVSALIVAEKFLLWIAKS